MTKSRPSLSPTVNQLRYLLAVVDSPTWAVAAREVGVSPSALSQALAELERRLGLVLFERAGRRRVLRDDAEQAVAYARRVVADTKELERWIEAHQEGRSNRLRLGMIDAAAVGHYAKQVQDFRSARPDVALTLTVAPSATLLELLRRNDLDLVVVVRPVERPPDVSWVELMAEPLGIYAPNGAEVGTPATWGPWIAFPPSSHTRQLIAKELMYLGVDYEVVAESHQPDVVRHMVHLGLGWAVLPVIQAEAVPAPLRPARESPLFERVLVAARREAALPHPLVDDLLGRLVS